MDIDRAMKNPASTFTTPEALSESSELTADQKRKVLLQWKDQLQQLQAADDEGMQQNDAAASTTDGSVSSSATSSADLACLACMVPRALAAAARTSAFGSLSAATASFSASKFPLSTPSAVRALERFSALSISRAA